MTLGETEGGQGGGQRYPERPGRQLCGGQRGGGTVCGRPLAHTPAPLSTLLTLLTLGSPRCPCPPPSTALCARIISRQRRRRRWSHPSEGSLFLSPSACSCLSSLAACILSLFSPRRGDTKRHLPGRDKPILEMPRGNLTLPASPPLVPFILLSLPGRAVLRWASSTISCVCILVFMCVCVRFKGFCLYSSPVNLIHGGQRRQGGDSQGHFLGSCVSFPG